MRIGIPREIFEGERRVSVTPAAVGDLVDLGYEVVVEAGAGRPAHFRDAAYRSRGARIEEEREAVWGEADILVKVRAPQHDPEADRHEVDLLAEGAILISMIGPAQDEELLERLAERRVTAFALDAVPRISRAQSVDVLSSMAGIAGYRAVIEAAYHSGRYLSAQVTAAGSTPPARALVIGAGVAGLAAVATAREIGAEVWAFDTREEVREQIESLGANFLEMEFDESGEGEGGYAKEMSEEFLQAERDLFARQARETDIIVTTASVPGKPAPMLISEEAVEAMRPGSVIVDLAAEQGGNCALTEPGEIVERDGVTIVGTTNITSRLATHASHYFANNALNFLKLLGEPDEFAVDTEDRLIRAMMVTRHGEVTWPPPEPEEPSPPPEAEEPDEEPAEPAPPTEADQTAEPEPTEAPGVTTLAGVVLAGSLLLVLLGVAAPPSFIQHLTVFVLACFVGWQVIWNVTSSLHTPLMSVTNAISGIIIVGGLLQVTAGASLAVLILGAVATAVASINIFGGFFVTQRMLGMFRAERQERS